MDRPLSCLARGTCKGCVYNRYPEMLCSRGIRPEHWSWRDIDPASPEYYPAFTHGQQASTLAALPKVTIYDFDEVEQLTGLVQHLRNEVAEMKIKHEKGVDGKSTGVVPL